MAKISIQLNGIKGLQQFIEKRKDLKPFQQVVAKYGAKLKDKTISNMYSTYKVNRHTAKTVTNELSNGGLRATVAPHTEYFPYLEYGTRFMSPRPTLKPAFAYVSVQFVNELEKLMK